MNNTLSKNDEIVKQAGVNLDNPTNCLWWARFSNKRFQESLRIYTTNIVRAKDEHEARIIVRLVNKWCKRINFTHPELIKAFRYSEAAWYDWKDFLYLEMSDLQSALSLSLADNVAYHLEFIQQFLTFLDDGEIFKSGVPWSRSTHTIPNHL